MDDLQFIGSYTTPVFFNEVCRPVVYSGECPRDEYDDIFLVFLIFVVLCVYIISLSVDYLYEKKERIIEIAPNSHADFLERINFLGEVPPELMCPIMQCIMQDPVRIYGGHQAHVFERTAFEKWIQEGKNVNPLTRESLSTPLKLLPANDVAEKIKVWLGDLRLRRHVFSIWSHGKVAGKCPRSDVADSTVLP